MPVKWMKFHIEMLNDPKMAQLNNEDWGIFTKLLLLSAQVDKGGVIPGRPKDGGYTRKELAHFHHTDLEHLNDLITTLRRLKIISTQRNGNMVFTNYQKRQAKPPSAEPERIAERVKRHRDNVTSLKRDCNDPVTNIEEEVDVEVEEEVDVEVEKTVSVSSFPDNNYHIKEIVSKLTGNGIPPPSEEQISQAMDEYVVKNILEAIDIATSNGSPDWRYVLGVLKNWQKDSKPKPKKRDKTKPIDPDKYTSGPLGHLVKTRLDD